MRNLIEKSRKTDVSKPELKLPLIRIKVTLRDEIVKFFIQKYFTMNVSQQRYRVKGILGIVSLYLVYSSGKEYLEISVLYFLFFPIFSLWETCQFLGFSCMDIKLNVDLAGWLLWIYDYKPSKIWPEVRWQGNSNVELSLISLSRTEANGNMSPRSLHENHIYYIQAPSNYKLFWEIPGY